LNSTVSQKPDRKDPIKGDQTLTLRTESQGLASPLSLDSLENPFGSIPRTPVHVLPSLTSDTHAIFSAHGDAEKSAPDAGSQPHITQQDQVPIGVVSALPPVVPAVGDDSGRNHSKDPGLTESIDIFNPATFDYMSNSAKQNIGGLVARKADG